MTTYKVSELQGALLDAAVAMAEGYEVQPGNEHWVRRADTGVRMTPWFSRDWALGGPIIAREQIAVMPPRADGAPWSACAFLPPADLMVRGEGPTPLIAAMRCCVFSKFGDTVEMP